MFKTLFIVTLNAVKRGTSFVVAFLSMSGLLGMLSLLFSPPQRLGFSLVALRCTHVSDPDYANDTVKV